MEVSQGIDRLSALPPGSVISVGNFDGVHLGHQAIIARMRELAREAPIAVVTFEPHPLTVLRPHLAPPRLTSAVTKRQLLVDAGVDHLIVLPPSPDVLGLTAEQFWQILRDDVRPAHIVEGRAFNFGRDRAGTITRLQEWARDTPIAVHLVPSAECTLSDRSVIDVSSSTIRWLLGNGRVRDAAACLGRPFELSGEVVKGFARGRTIGVPTANLQCDDLVVPADGVYAGEAIVLDVRYPAAISIGATPTFDRNQFQVEVHLIGFTGDLYGQTLHVRVLEWIRDQAKFPSVDELKVQLGRDLESARLAARE
ncbi:MAG: riboflavin biosynthesis protein RibF [Burkholderiales bacterium]|nr:riboflavin biosynthesis protein RibF [Phycisphaerae bacterium]